jgi:arylsulfatase A-like enzyme
MNPYNILLIVADSLRADFAWPCMPEFMELGTSQGRVFHNAYTTAPWTLAANHAILYSRHPGKLQVADITKCDTYDVMRKHPETYVPQVSLEQTLPSVLQSKGYQTHALVGGGFVSDRFGFNHGFNTFYEYNWLYMEVARLEQTISMMPKNQPWFIYSQDYDTHEPHGRWPRESQHKELINRVKEEDGQYRTSGFSVMSATDREQIKHYYKESCVQYGIKLLRLMHYLADTKVLDNTIVIFTSDHGEELWEHMNWGGHGWSLYEGVVKVPLVMFAPRLTSEDIWYPVSHVDIGATVLDCETFGEGKNLLSNKRNDVFAEVVCKANWPDTQQSPCSEVFKFVRRCMESDGETKKITTLYNDGFLEEEEYNLMLDSEESENLAYKRKENSHLERNAHKL